MDDLIEQQKSSAEKLNSNYENFKKTPLDRRTPELCGEHRRRVRTFWNQFQTIDQDIQEFDEYNTSEYKNSNYFNAVRSLCQRYEERISKFEGDYAKSQHLKTTSTITTPTTTPAESAGATADTTPVTTPAASTTATPTQKADSTSNSTAQTASTMVDFEREKSKRTQKITQLNELIGKLDVFLTENKSIQFLEQKVKQLTIIWDGITHITDIMMGEANYNDSHNHELNSI